MDEGARITAITSKLTNRGAGLSRWIGDDAAIVGSRGDAVTSIDAVVDGVHFRRAYATPNDIGHKAAASALSDLAAMGVAASELYVAIGMPEDFSDEDLLDLYDGLEQVAATCSATVAGGDMSAAPVLWLAVTVVGWTDDSNGTIRRDGATAGELVVVTGRLGGAAAGLALLENQVDAESLDQLDPLTLASLQERHLRPTAQLALGQSLASAGVSSMIDISDGIARDAGQLAEQSNCGVRIELPELPLQTGVAEVAAKLGFDPHEFAAIGGEDYELLCTVPSERLEAATKAVASGGGSLKCIGSTTAAGVELIGADGLVRQLQGFEHFV